MSFDASYGWGVEEGVPASSRQAGLSLCPLATGQPPNAETTVSGFEGPARNDAPAASATALAAPVPDEAARLEGAGTRLLTSKVTSVITSVRG
jgi:hypothetical protein